MWLLQGCANELPPSASTNLNFSSEEDGTRWLLGDEEAARAAAAFGELAAGHTVVRPPGRVPEGRFSDLRDAVDLACREQEMAVVRADRQGDRWVFRLKTIEGWRGELTVDRVDGPEVYQAVATIGLLGEHADRARRLEVELRKQIEVLGAIKK